MKQIPWLIVFLILSAGCGTLRSSVSQELSYQDKKRFDTYFFEASKQKVLGNYDKALEGYIKALDVDNSSHAAMYEVAKIYYRAKRYEQALTWAKGAVASSPSYNKWYYGQLAQYYNRMGQYEQAASTFVTMIGNEPDVRNYYIEASNQYLNHGDEDKAVDWLLRMQDHFGIEEVSATRLDHIYIKSDEPEKGTESLRKLVATNPDNIRFNGLLVNSLLRQNKVAEAEEVLQHIVSLDSTDGRAHYSLHEIYYRAGKEELAFTHLVMAFRSDDISIQQKLQTVSHYFLTLRGSRNSQEELLELSDILLEVHPTEKEAYLLRADYHSTLGEFRVARDYLKKAVEFDPGDYKLWSKLFTVNANLREYQWQYNDVSAALELFPNMVQLYLTKAYAAYDMGRYNESIEIANAGLEVSIENADIVNLKLCIAGSYDKLKQHANADRNFEEALSLDASNATALNNYAYTLAERGVHLNKADSLCTRALELDKRNPYFMDTKAWILYQLEQYEEAMLWLTEAMALNPGDIEIYIHAKQVYLKMGNQTMANAMQDKIDKLKNEEK